MNKVALITGITGQDGSYLADFLLKKDYIVHGIKRRSSSLNTERIDHLYKDPLENKTNLFLHYGDMTDSTNLIRIIQQVKPDEIYNLAAMSHVHVSFDTPEYCANADAIGTLRILEAVRILALNNTRIYQASTSELYGLVDEIPQNEKTKFYPRSPYGVAKLYAYWISVNYREAYQIFVSNGILFNHESPVRGETFVTRKITRAVAKIALGLDKKLYLGNLSAKRDWGHAKDYVEAMWLILQAKSADDFVIATGITTEVREFVRLSFLEIGIYICFSGFGINEIGKITKIDSDLFKLTTGIMPTHLEENQIVIVVDPLYFRPTEVDILIGDSTKAKDILGWKPKLSLSDLVNEMVTSDIKLFKREKVLLDEGFEINSSLYDRLE